MKLSDGLVSKKTLLGVKEKQGEANAIFYNEGDENVALTGGWIVGYSALTASQSKEADHLLITMSTRNAYRTYVTANKIDFSEIDVLVAVLESEGPYTYNIIRVATNANGFHDSVAEIQKNGPVAKQAFSLDVSALSGEYYVSFLASTDPAGTVAAKCYGVWGIKL